MIHVQTAGAPAVAVLDQVRAVTKERFQSRLGTISKEEPEAIEDGLREVLEL